MSLGFKVLNTVFCLYVFDTTHIPIFNISTKNALFVTIIKTSTCSGMGCHPQGYKEQRNIIPTR